MTINSIEWHEQNLQNSLAYEVRMGNELAALQTKYDDLRLSNEHYMKQIERARREGKTSFTDKYKV